MQKEHTFTVDWLINGGGGTYTRNNTIRLKIDGLISEGLKTGGP